jgi:hypothetical protein
MKYILTYLYFGIIMVLMIPVFIIKWDLSGLSELASGVKKVFNTEDI